MKSLYYALNMALSMFTIIPLPKYEWDENSAKHMMKMYPFIGLIVGGLWYLVYILLEKFQCGIMLTSSILVSIPFLLTGFLHLDGFMDVCDALLSRRSKEEKIRILKDSRVGAFSVIALVIVFLIQFSSIYTILSEGKNTLYLIVIPMISRSLAGYFLITRDALSESYLGNLFKKGTGAIDRGILIALYIFSYIICYFVSGWIMCIIPLIMGIISYILVDKIKKELGGINGDVAGYVLVLSELFGIITVALL